MIILEPYTTRADGVKLVKRIAGSYAEDGRTVIPSGYKIRKINTEEYYAEAIDIETAPWDYEETDIPIELEELEEILDAYSLGYDGISDAEFRNIVEEAM